MPHERLHSWTQTGQTLKPPHGLSSGRCGLHWEELLSWSGRRLQSGLSHSFSSSGRRLLGRSLWRGRSAPRLHPLWRSLHTGTPRVELEEEMWRGVYLLSYHCKQEPFRFLWRSPLTTEHSCGRRVARWRLVCGFHTKCFHICSLTSGAERHWALGETLVYLVSVTFLSTRCFCRWTPAVWGGRSEVVQRQFEDKKWRVSLWLLTDFADR